MQVTMCQQWNTAREFSFHWIWSCLTSDWTVDSKSICTEAVSGGINDDKRALPTLSLFCRLSVEAALLAWENGLIELLDWNCSRFQQTSNEQWKIVVSEEAGMFIRCATGGSWKWRRSQKELLSAAAAFPNHNLVDWQAWKVGLVETEDKSVRLVGPVMSQNGARG